MSRTPAEIDQEISELTSSKKYSPVSVMLAAGFFLFNAILLSCSDGKSRRGMASFVSLYCTKLAQIFLDQAKADKTDDGAA